MTRPLVHAHIAAPTFPPDVEGLVTKIAPLLVATPTAASVLHNGAVAPHAAAVLSPGVLGRALLQRHDGVLLSNVREVSAVPECLDHVRVL